MIAAWSSISATSRRAVSGWIDQHLDHRMILNRNDPAVPAVLEMLGEPMYLLDVNPTAGTSPA